MLSLPEGPDTPSKASILYYKIADLPRAYAMLQEQGVKTIQEPHLTAKMEDHELWMAFIEDTEGNLLGLMSEQPLVD